MAYQIGDTDVKKVTDDGEIVDDLCEDCNPIPVPAPYWKTGHNHDRDAESKRLGLTCRDVSKTKQEFAKDADINVILAKFMAGGGLPLTGEPSYQNFEEEFDLQSSIVTASQVEEAWDALPAAVRNILKDPRTFVSYIDHCLATGDINPLRELGLADKLPEPPAPPGGSPAPPTEKAASEAAKTPPTGAKSDT